MNTLPDEVKEKAMKWNLAIEWAARYKTGEWFEKLRIEAFIAGWEEYAKAYAPVPGKEEMKIPSHNMFMAGGNTQSEKEFYQLGFLAGASFNSDAVEFAEWADNNYFGIGDGLWAVSIGEIEEKRYTTQELYNLFKQKP